MKKQKTYWIDLGFKRKTLHKPYNTEQVKKIK